jgi:hypothetical protein
MRRYLLLFLLGVAAANPPALSPAQQAWLVAWMNQLQVRADHPQYAAVRSYDKGELLAGNIDIDPPPVESEDPTLSRTTCDRVAEAVPAKAAERRRMQAAEGTCREAAPATQDPASACAREIAQVVALSRAERDMREDYRKGCKGRYPPAH